MIKHLSIPAVFASATVILTAMPVFAVTDKAPCSSFQKLPDGKWNVLRPVKIENGKVTVTINPGTSISPSTRVAGVNLYAALEKSCRTN
jgi:hypothetical protein